MNRFKKTKSSSQSKDTQKKLYYLTLVVSLLIAYVAFSTFLAYRLWSIRENDFTQIRGLIVDSLDRMYKPAIIVPQESKQYIHEAGIMFELPKDKEVFRYTHIPSIENDSWPASVELSSDTLLNIYIGRLSSDKSLFDNVPTLQKCTKMFTLVFDDTSTPLDNFSHFKTITLQDGRIAQLYQNNSCNELYESDVFDINSYREILESVQSY